MQATRTLAQRLLTSTARPNSRSILRPTTAANRIAAETASRVATGLAARTLGRSLFSTNASSQKETAPTAQYGQPTWMTHPHLMKQGEITPGLSAAEYELRRTLLMESLPENSIVVATSHKTRFMTNNIFYPFHQHTDFHYLCGFNEPDSALVLEKDSSAPRGYRMTMFVAPKNANIEMWEGARTGIEAAKEVFGADEAIDANLFRYRIVDMAGRYEHVYYDYPTPSMFLPMDIAKKLHNRPDSDAMASTKNLSPLIQELRVIKSVSEIKLMRQAGEISGKAFIETMKFTNPSRLEHQIYAKFDFECRMRGSQMMAYVPVVAGGSNALTMHYVNNDQPLQDGDLLLMDAGGEYNGYASDITRTWPVNGKFTQAQKDLYSVVLNANKECIKLCTEEHGLTLNQIHDVSMRLTKEGLARLGIKPLPHDVDRRLYPHHVGHYLGMDVHDTGDISRSRPLKEGMVITIEPGLYIPRDPAYPEKYQGIGIRIEDNVVIGKTVPTVLSVTAPKEIVDIEYCCANRADIQEPQQESSLPRNPSQSLGQAFLIIFQAARSTIRKALTVQDSENILWKAIHTLTDHVQSVKDDDESLVMTRSLEVLRPFLDKTMKKSDENAKKVSFILLDWLLLDHAGCRIRMAQALGQELGPQAHQDKKRKLAALLALEHALSTRNKRIAEKKRKTEEEEVAAATTAKAEGNELGKKPTEHQASEDVDKKSNANFLDIPEVSSRRSSTGGRVMVEVIEGSAPDMSLQHNDEINHTSQHVSADESIAPFQGPILAEWISHLCHITRHDGATGSDGIASMTRLTGLAQQMAMVLSKMLSKATLRELEIEDENEKEEHRKREAAKRLPIKSRKGQPLIVELHSEPLDKSLQKDSGSKKREDMQLIRWSFSKSLASIRGIIEDVKTWNRDKNWILTAALNDTLDMLTRFDRHYQRQLLEAEGTQSGFRPSPRTGAPGNRPPGPPPFREIVRSFAKCWVPIVSAINPEGPATTYAIVMSIQETVDQKELPPFVQLHAIGFYLGHCDPEIPLSEVFESPTTTTTTITTTSGGLIMPALDGDKLKAQIVEMAKVVIELGLPVGRNVALAVDKHLKNRNSSEKESQQQKQQRLILPLRTLLSHSANKEPPEPTIDMVD
ncbi:hypothetical protein BGZ83_008835 [Gryganskiella cystojenkinii]|nr:hypothetical protein BGZ83_008835 [Gryganskiella cystojenkinii]